MKKRIVQLAVFVFAYGVAGMNIFLFATGIRLPIQVFQGIRLTSGVTIIFVTSILYLTQKEN